MKASKEQKIIWKRAGWLGKTIPIIERSLCFGKIDRNEFWFRLFELLDKPPVDFEAMNLDQKISVAESIIDRFNITTNKCRHIFP